MVPARKIRSACLRFLPAPLGAWVVQICCWCSFRTAPEYAEPTLPISNLPPGGRTIPPIRGKCPKGTKGVGGHGEAVTDEGALLDRNPYSNGRAGEGTRPYGENRTVAVGSAEPGAVVEPQQRQFLQTQGPVARMEPQKVTRRRGGETPPVKQKPSSSSAERKISSPSTAPQ